MTSLAGITRIRSEGCDLSPPAFGRTGTPVIFNLTAHPLGGETTQGSSRGFGVP